MNRLKWAVFPLIAIMLLLSGCTHQHPLTYTPVVKKQCIKNITISVNDIVDRTGNNNKISHHRNRLYIPIHSVKSQNSAHDWVTHALQAELSNAGYFIHLLDPSSQYSINGDIYKLFSDNYIFFNCNIKLKLNLMKDNHTLFSKVYEIKRKKLFFLLSFVGIETRLFDVCLQEICKEFVDDVNTCFSNEVRFSTPALKSMVREKGHMDEV